jgi:hypothetical protein
VQNENVHNNNIKSRQRTKNDKESADRKKCPHFSNFCLLPISAACDFWIKMQQKRQNYEAFWQKKVIRRLKPIPI